MNDSYCSKKVYIFKIKNFKLFFIFLFFVPAVYGQDTSPPIIIENARDTSFECTTNNIIGKLTEWYNKAGSAVAIDNSGNYTFEGNITLAQAISIFNTPADTICRIKNFVRVSFIAVDNSGNRSLPTIATFYARDNVGPIVNSVPNVKYRCNIGIRDTLISWIRAKGGYIATETCSGPAVWTTFQYSISANNITLLSGSGSIANGLYPNIPDGICEWRMNINFFVIDQCGNQTITPGTTTFTVTDDVAPVFIPIPRDITVGCHQLPVATPRVVDGCDLSVVVTNTQSSTKSANPSTCGHYDYSIIYTWTATDKCGNTSTAIQNVNVVDTLGPLVTSLPKIEVNCLVFDTKPDSVFIKYIDNCSAIIIVFTDTIRQQGCNSLLDRYYTLTDVCGNTSNYKQEIRVLQNQKPILTNQASNKSFGCAEQVDFNAELALWIVDMGGSRASGVCAEVSSFAAIKDSYDPNNPSTYPGIKPIMLLRQSCPSTLVGLLRGVEVDFFYYDSCGNYAVTKGVFGIEDDSKPMIVNCPGDMTFRAEANKCSLGLKLAVPKVQDDCVEAESPVVRSIVKNITSANPGNNESIVDEVQIKLGPFNPAHITPLAGGIVNFRLSNVDIDDATEYFNIFDEDNIFVARTPIGSGQCSNISFDVTVDTASIKRWIKDGFIIYTFKPNVVPGSPVLSINDICNGSTLSSIISFEIDLKNTLTKRLELNGFPLQADLTSDTLSVVLPVGNSTITYYFQDCAQNEAICNFVVTVQDRQAPVMQCPEDKLLYVSSNVCRDTLQLPLDLIVVENCGGTRVFDKNSPLSKEAALISFTVTESNALARNRQFLFTDLFKINNSTLPVKVFIDFFGDNNEDGEYWDIIGPGGYVIGRTSVVQSSKNCNLVKDFFEIPYDVFNIWILNGQVTILAIPNNKAIVNGGGINACTTIPTGNTIDGQSFLQARLVYSDATFRYSVTGATTLNNINIAGGVASIDIPLNTGNNTITISTLDASLNRGSCSFVVAVRDTFSPLVKCKNAVITIDPSGLVPFVIDPKVIDGGSNDNCGITSMVASPAIFDCSMIGKDVATKLVVRDAQGNIDSCMAIVKVKSLELTPTYSSGLCETDTLRLFANVPTASVSGTYTFLWRGPNGIEFSTENPFVPNATETLNGTYTLTVIGFNGCVSSGTILVNIKPLTNPALTTKSPTVCEKEVVVLSTSSFSGNITYEWYEGIFPTGVLLRTTQVAELTWNPTVGVHFYYVIAKGPDCTSKPSPLLKVTVLKTPEVTVNNLLLTPCEGEDVALGTSTSNPNFTFTWTGPNGYNETGQTPKVIKNVSELNAGVYKLVVNNGACKSDTATTTVQVFERPSRPTLSTAEIFCQGATINMVALLSTNADKYEWFLNNMLYTTTQTNILIITNVQNPLQGSWSVRAVKGNCNSEFSISKAVAIDNLLQVAATNSGPICAGDSLQLQATFVPNATYKWSGPINNIPSISNPKILGVAGEYSVTITTPTLCSNNANTNVQVTSVPQITAVSNTSINCVSPGDTISFSPSIFPNSADFTYQWRGSNSFSSTVRNPFITNLTALDTGSYTLTVFNKGCPSKPVTTLVRFSLKPVAATFDFPLFVCVGDTLVLTPKNIFTNASYQWVTPLGSFVQKTPSFVVGNVALQNQGFYSLRVIQGDCSSDTLSAINIMVRQKPLAPEILGPFAYCYGDTIKLTSSGSSNLGFEWLGPNGFQSSLSSPIIADANESSSGLYTVKTVLNGCASSGNNAKEVKVKAKISSPVFSLKTVVVCENAVLGTELCFDPNFILPNAVIKVYNQANGLLLSQGSSICQQLITVDLFGVGIHYLYATNEVDGCQSSASEPIILVINEVPKLRAEAIEDDINTCESFVTLLALSGPPLVEVKWSALTPQLTINDDKIIDPIISNLSNGDNKVLLSYSVPGCSNFSRDTISIYKEFLPSAADDIYDLQSDVPNVLEVLKNDIVSRKTTITIVSQPAKGSVRIDKNNIIYDPDPRFLEVQTFRYKVCVTECPQLCSEGQVTLRVGDIIVCKPPTIITPNGDGINDQFVVPCLSAEKYSRNNVVFFNEWGTKVYEASPYRNEWAGTFNGDPVPVGTYFYVIDLGDGSKPLNGFLIIQR